MATSPVAGPGRSSITRQQLDDALANVAAGFSEFLSNAGSAKRLAETLSSIPSATLQAPPDATPPGFGYSSDQAFAIGLFGNLISAALAYWESGQAIPAQTAPTPAKHALTFVGL